MLAAIGGGTLSAGNHALSLIAADANHNTTTADVTFDLVTVPPVFSAALADNTSRSSSHITSDDAISGTASDPAGIVALEGALDAGTTFINFSSSIGSGGTFGISSWALGALGGGTITNGAHSVTLQAVDGAGNVTTQTISFTLQTSAITPTFSLAAADQSTGSETATGNSVTLVGTTSPGAMLNLTNSGATTFADTSGAFQFANVPLASGANPITVKATDLAGDTASATETIELQTSTGTVDPVLQWNTLTLQAIATDADAPTVASRAMAMESLAVYDAISAIDRTPGYLLKLAAPADASAPAAVAEAADQVLDYLYPAQAATFDAQLTTALSAISAGQGKTDGVALGKTAAQDIIALRANDGSQTTVIDNGSSAVGQWQPTAPGFGNAVTPEWANVTPFALNNPDQFLPGPPPDLTSAAYAAAVDETESLGAGNSTTRTADETQIALFWNDQTGTFTPPGEWNAIATSVAQKQGDSMATDAQMLAELNVAEADSAIAAWNVKFTYNAWRPIQAIQNANEIGNSGITQDRPGHR